MKLLAVLALVLAAPLAAAAQALVLPSGNPFTSGLVTPTGRTNITTEATAKINAASRAPIPTTPVVAVVRPDVTWVPDRYVSAPGAPGGVLVPGHWERRVSDREVYAPPLAIDAPGGAAQTVPAGVRPPAEQRVEP